MWAIFVIVKKVAKEISHTMGENAPNLVTLLLDVTKI
jgi:hypothetical protein